MNFLAWWNRYFAVLFEGSFRFCVKQPSCIQIHSIYQNQLLFTAVKSGLPSPDSIFFSILFPFDEPDLLSGGSPCLFYNNKNYSTTRDYVLQLLKVFYLFQFLYSLLLAFNESDLLLSDRFVLWKTNSNYQCHLTRYTSRLTRSLLELLADIKLNSFSTCPIWRSNWRLP